MEYRPEENLDQFNTESENIDEEQQAETGLEEDTAENQSDAAAGDNLFSDSEADEASLSETDDTDSKSTATDYQQENAFDSVLDDSIAAQEPQESAKSATAQKAESADTVSSLFSDSSESSAAASTTTDDSLKTAADKLDSGTESLFGDAADNDTETTKDRFVILRDEDISTLNDLPERINDWFNDSTELGIATKATFLEYLNNTSDDVYKRRDVARYAYEHQNEFKEKLDFITSRFNMECTNGAEFGQAVKLMMGSDWTFISVHSGYEVDDILSIGKDESSGNSLRSTSGFFKLGSSRELDSKRLKSMQEKTENPFNNSYTSSDMRGGSFEKIVSNATYMTDCKPTVIAAIENIEPVPTEKFSLDSTVKFEDIIEYANQAADPETKLDLETLQDNGLPSIRDKAFRQHLDDRLVVELSTNDEYKAIKEAHADFFPSETEDTGKKKKKITAKALIDELKNNGSDEEKSKIAELRRKYAFDLLQKAVEAPINKCENASAETLTDMANSEYYYVRWDKENHSKNLMQKLEKNDLFDFVDYAGDIMATRTQNTRVQGTSTSEISRTRKSEFTETTAAVLDEKQDEFISAHADALAKILDNDAFKNVVSNAFANESHDGLNLNKYVYNILKNVLVKQQFESLGVEKLSDLIGKDADFSKISDAIDIEKAKDEAYGICLKRFN